MKLKTNPMQAQNVVEFSNKDLRPGAAVSDKGTTITSKARTQLPILGTVHFLSFIGIRH